MHGPINVKSPNDINKWQMGFNSEFKGLTDGGKFLRQTRENYHAMKIKASGVNQKIQSSKQERACN
jgi:hypothetical protein